jgi:hypothetical protein
MQKLVLGIAAAAALAFAAPQATMAQHQGGGGGSHVSGGGGGGGGGRSFGGGGRSYSGHSSAARSFSGGVSNRGISSRSFNSGRSFHGHAHQSRMNRNFAAANDGALRSRSVNRIDRRVANQRIASNDRHRHRHHRHHRHFSGVWWGPTYYYDDYAAYDGCYQWVWTNFGYRYVDTCSTDYYGVY